MRPAGASHAHFDAFLHTQACGVATHARRGAGAAQLTALHARTYAHSVTLMTLWCNTNMDEALHCIALHCAGMRLLWAAVAESVLSVPSAVRMGCLLNL